MGSWKAIAISAIAFGIYHWFSYTLFGNTAAMIYVFIITTLMGWVLAYAYAKTYSMYIAIGFHFGWNFINGFVFSKGSIGNGVFMLTSKQPVVTISYFTFYSVTILPLIFAIVSSYLLVRKWNATKEELPGQSPK